MRETCATGATILLFAVIAAAQLPTSGNVFLGYSYTHGEAFTSNKKGVIAPALGGASMTGWNASAEGQFLPWLSGVIDFDWHYGGHEFAPCANLSCTQKPFHLSASRHTLLIGPRASMSFGKYTPFAEFLVGVANQTDSGAGISNSDMTFSTAFGGGVDYKLLKGVAWRGQADSVHTSFFGHGENDLRISTGIVFRF